MDRNILYLLGIVALTGFAEGGDVLPLKGVTSQSSNPENACRAIDGNREGNYFYRVTYGSCTHTATEDNPWWRLDLQDEYKIASIHITNRGDCCSERINGAEIHVGNSLSNNGNDNPVVAVVSSIPAGKKQIFTMKGVSGRYVNVIIPGQNRILTLCEVQVFGSRLSGGDVLPLKGVTSQSSHPENACRAIDGNQEGNYFHPVYYGSCTHTATEDNPWWRLDLQDQYTLTSITITNRGDCCSERINGAEIRVGNSLSNNGNDNPVVAVISSIPAGKDQIFTMKGVSGRYINVIIPGQNRILTLCEVTVFGSRRSGGLRGVASQSSNQENAYKAIDGNRDGNYFSGSCTHTGYDQSPWWELDMKNTHKVSSITITNRQDDASERLNGAEIRIGDSPAHNGIYNPRCGVVCSIGKNPSVTFDCNGMRGRYVTVVIPGRNEYLTLCEVEVFGAPLQ